MNTVKKIIILYSIVLIACKNSNDNNQLYIDTTINLTNFKTINYSLPSNLEMYVLLKNSTNKLTIPQIQHNKNFSKFSTSSALALNFGLYLTDFVFVVSRDFSKESEFLSIFDSIMINLNLKSLFSSQYINSFEKKENNDSVFKKITKVYFDIDAYLNENNLKTIEAYILVGSWVEFSYIIFANKNNFTNNNLYELLINQKYTLDIIRKIAAGKITKDLTTRLDLLQIELDEVVNLQEQDYNEQNKVIRKKITIDQIAEIEKMVNDIRIYIVELN